MKVKKYSQPERVGRRRTRVSLDQEEIWEAKRRRIRNSALTWSTL